MRTLSDQWDDTDRAWSNQPLRPVDVDVFHGVPVQQRSHLTVEQCRQLAQLNAVGRAIKTGSAAVWDNAVDFLPFSKRGTR